MNDVWSCACGWLNGMYGTHCLMCGRSRDGIEDHYPSLTPGSIGSVETNGETRIVPVPTGKYCGLVRIEAVNHIWPRKETA